MFHRLRYAARVACHFKTNDSSIRMIVKKKKRKENPQETSDPQVDQITYLPKAGDSNGARHTGKAEAGRKICSRFPRGSSSQVSYTTGL